MSRSLCHNVILSKTAALIFLSSIFPSQNLSAARLSVLYSGGGSQKTYTRVFVTSTTYDGNLGGIAGADAKCQARADAASLGGTWKAILSDSTVNARDRMTFRRLPVFNMKGHLVWNPVSLITYSGATDYGAWGYAEAPPFNRTYFGTSSTHIGAPISYDETATLLASSMVWTGTTVYGVATTHCSNWTSTGATGGVGYNTYINSGWVNQASVVGTNVARLYCLEDE